MRAIAVAALLLFVVPASAAEYWDGDNLLACFVGKGAVEMRHGATAENAISAVRDECVATAAEPEPSEEPEGEWGDYLDYVHGVALGILTAAEDAWSVF